MNDDTWVLVNPAAGGGRCGRRSRALRAAIAARWPGARWVETTSGADLTAQARAAAAAGAARVLVAGGDGSAHLAAEALLGTCTALGIVPAGTGNDLAASVGLAPDLAAALDALAEGAVRAIDVARVASGDGRGRARFVTCVVGLGMDSDAMDRVDGARWLPRGRLLYTLAALRTVFAYAPPALRVVVDGRTVHDGPLFFGAVANTSTYAGGVRVAPGARVDDGLLDVCAIPPLGGRLRQAASFSAVRDGTHGALPGVALARGRRVVIDGDRVPVTVDGERTDLRTPIEVDVLPGALRVLVGRAAVAVAVEVEVEGRAA
jgi:diacylglycerol kinase (ATP)